MFSEDYQYTLFYVEFPSLEKRWEDSFTFENSKNIGTIRLMRAGNILYSLVNGQKSVLSNPSWCGDVLVTQMDLSSFFANAPTGERSCVVWREKHAH